MRKPDLHSVELNLRGWKETERRNTEIHWVDASGVLLSLHFFPVRPDLPAAVRDVDKLRESTRAQLADVGGGLIELDHVVVQDLPAVRQIAKFHTEDGNAYVDSITLPFRDFSFVVKVQSIEQGTTGIREAVVTDRLLQEDDADPGDLMASFFADPYDPSFHGTLRPSLRALSDDERYDELVPDHPLSQVRSCLTLVVQSVDLGMELFEAPGFHA